MIHEVINIAKAASVEILKIYSLPKCNFDLKEDLSPITEADIKSNEIIISGLKKISNYPILTEESLVGYNERKTWNKYWLVDPLDGTKGFIDRDGGFTVNIALIENNQPILGVVYIPVSNDVFYAEKGKGALKNGSIIFNNSKRVNLIGADSVHHSTKGVHQFFKKNNITNIQKIGSSIKICKLAEGVIDVYPRLNGTSEWDTAASHIIANEAGCKLIDIETKTEISYNKKNLRNNYFIASKNNLNFYI